MSSLDVHRLPLEVEMELQRVMDTPIEFRTTDLLWENPDLESPFITPEGSEIFNLGPIEAPNFDTHDVFVLVEVKASDGRPDLVGSNVVLQVGPQGSVQYRADLSKNLPKNH